jgi:hypothetical protein
MADKGTLAQKRELQIMIEKPKKSGKRFIGCWWKRGSILSEKNKKVGCLTCGIRL